MSLLPRQILNNMGIQSTKRQIMKRLFKTLILKQPEHKEHFDLEATAHFLNLITLRIL